MTLGCVIGGSIVGPGGYNSIQEHVQVESVAELGLVFLMFELGFSFSAGRIFKFMLVFLYRCYTYTLGMSEVFLDVGRWSCIFCVMSVLDDE